ncbi:TolC family protein [Flexithrix dorotheae]|uniref:TolC family protein n=1 Tax=Flexithrix dorotheae TaxID=70993 RepID=UPI00037BAA9D|nr:TolC family protein [Flexithrix dorotheae]
MQKKINLLFLSFILSQIVIYNNAYSQDITDRLALKDCINYALKHSHDVKIADYEYESAENRIKEIRGTGLPQINAFATFDNNLKLPTQVLPGEILGEPGTTLPVQFGTTYSSTGGIEANQLIFDQSYFVGLQATKASREYYALNQLKTDEDVIYHVASNYYNALYLQEQLNIINDNLKKLDQLLSIMKVRVENDLVKSVDYNRVKVNKTNLETQRKSLITSFESQVSRLKYLMGMPIEENISLDNTAITTFNEKEVLKNNNLEIEERIEIQILNKQLELNQLNQKNIQSGYYPSLMLYGRYYFQGLRNSFGDLYSKKWFDAAVIGLKLNIPIFDGFQKKYKVAQSKIDQSILTENIYKTASYISLEQQTASSQLMNSLESLEAQEENMALAEKVYNQVNSLYKEGVSQLSDLLDAETSLREARIGYNTEVIKIKQAELDLIKAKGHLNSIAE